MSNTLLTPLVITRECLRVLHAESSFLRTINREYDDRFAKPGAKIGSVLNIRKPARYTVTTGAALSTQDSTDTFVALTVSTQKHVDLAFTSVESTMSLDDVSERYIVPAMSVLVANVEADAMLNLYKTVFNQVGSATSPFNSTRPMAQARKRLNDQLAPMDNSRSLLLNTDSQVEIMDAIKNQFNPTGAISDIYEKGMLTKIMGLKLYEDTLLPVHTPGTLGGTPLINGATASGATSIVTDGWSAAATMKKGDVFTLAGVYGVHPETRQAYGYLQQFVATADATADGSGNMTIAIYPAIVTSGGFQTVNAVPADNAAITNYSAGTTPYGINLAYHKDAFTFATADLIDVSAMGAKCARESLDGISLRYVEQYVIGTDVAATRIDILYGQTAMYPELSCRVGNQQSTS